MAQEAAVQEAGTLPSVSYTASFFNPTATDQRFLNVKYCKFLPQNAVDSNARNIDFCLPKLEPPNCYLIDSTLLQCNIQLSVKGQKPILANKLVAPINNILHSLWKKVDLHINDQCLSVNNDLYHYKSYMVNLMTYGSDAKQTHLQTQGWCSDLRGNFQAETTNAGFFFRNGLFRRDMEASTEYLPEGVLLIGRLCHDLFNCETAIPFNVKVNFYLERASDDFVLLKNGTDSDLYEITLSNLALYCKVGVLSTCMYQELSTRWNKEDLKFHYRRIAIRPIGLPRHKQEVYTESLFTEENPVRIFVAFVETNAKNGNQTLNPYFFGRKWTGDFGLYPTTSQQVEQNYYVSRIKTLEESIHFLVNAELKRQYPETNINSEKTPKRTRETKNRGRGKKSSTSARNSASLLSRISNAFLDPEPIASCSRNECSTTSGSTNSSISGRKPEDTESIISQLCDPKLDGQQTFHLTNISLSINGTEIDQISSDQTESHAFTDFFRFNATNCFVNNIQSNGISYKDYMNGFFIAGFDLSTSSESGDPYYTPTVRVGQLRLWVKFDKPIPTDLTMLCFAEYPSLMELSKEGKMKTSYSIN